MTALAKNTGRRAKSGGSAAQVANTKVIYSGALVSLGNASHATSGTPGRMTPFTGILGEIPAGIMNGANATGDTAAVPEPISRYVQDQDEDFLLPVTGLAGTVADNYKYVYATDDGTYTLTIQTAPNTCPVGFVSKFNNSTTAWVTLMGLRTRMWLGLMPGQPGLRTELIGLVGPSIASSGNVLTGFVLRGHGKITSCFAVCVIGPTDADFAGTLNLEIGGVDVTGGVITVATADVAGDKLAGTSITAANEFHDGDLLDVEVAIGTAGTVTDPGSYNVYAVIQSLPGL